MPKDGNFFMTMTAKTFREFLSRAKQGESEDEIIEYYMSDAHPRVA